ncbi:hypothetical protein ACKKBG_A00370 [Auxenochlorella protothecoides x Auxenochlorella symbiontica]
MLLTLLWLLGSLLLSTLAFWLFSGRFHVRSRIAAGVVDRLLRNLLDTGEPQQPKLNVVPTATGVRLSGLHLSGAALGGLSAAGMELHSAELRHLELDLPSFTRPLRVVARGISVELRQLRMPEARGAAQMAEDRASALARDRRRRLQVVDRLLWGEAPRPAPAAPFWLLGPLSRLTRGLAARAQAATLQRGAALLARSVQVSVREVRVRYVQAGEPGPRPAPGSHLEGCDGATLCLRSLSVLPLDPGPGAGVALDDEGAAGGEERRGGEDGTGPWHAAGAAADPVAGRAPAEVAWSAFRAARSALGALWFVAAPRPVAARLAVQGVSLDLHTWPATWRASGAGALPADVGASGAGVEAALASLVPETHRVFQQWELAVGVELRPHGGAGHETVTGLQAPSPAQRSPASATESSRFGRQASDTLDQELEEGDAPAGPEELAQGLFATQGGGEPPEGGGAGGATPTWEGSGAAAQRLARDSALPEPVTLVFDSDRKPAARRENGNGIPSAADPPGTSPVAEFPGRASPFAAVADAETAARGQEGAGGGESDPDGPAPRPPYARSGVGAPGARRVPAPAAPRVEVRVTLKAFVPEFDAASIAVLSRLVERALYVSRYEAYWAARPAHPIPGHAAEWWRHAGDLLVAGCAELSRRQAPLADVAARRRARLLHARAYAAACAGRPLFRAPRRRWWQRLGARVAGRGAGATGRGGAAVDAGGHGVGHPSPASAEAQRPSLAAGPRREAYERLEAIEAALTLEQVAHFRLALAATHNARLASDPALLRFIADKVDGIVLHRGQLDPGLETLLLHGDQPSLLEPTTPTAGPAAGVDLRLSLTCPKLGVALEVASARLGAAAAGPGGATSPAPTAAPDDTMDGGDRRPPRYICLALLGAALRLDAHGGAQLRVRELACGGARAPAAHPAPKIVSCPSRVCRHVCKAAEFFRYAVTGGMLSESAEGEAEDEGEVDFLHMAVSPRPGVGGAVVGSPSPRDPGWSPADWVPGGSNVVLSVAAVGVTYREHVIGALLDFADSCEACKHEPWLWSRQCGGPGPGAPPPRDPPPLPPAAPPRRRLPALPARPPGLEDMVLAMNAATGAAVASPLTLPTLGLEVRCPGIAAQLPYSHTLYLRHLDRDSTPGTLFSVSPELAGGGEERAGDARRGAPAGAGPRRGAAPRPALTYRLTLAAQNLRVVVSGEAAGSALSGGCARRVDATAFVDLFSYLSRESRAVIAAHLLPAREGLDALRAPLSDEAHRAATQGLQEALREAEIPSMAKVWAYPEDMPAILAGIREQQSGLAGGAGTGSGAGGGADGSDANKGRRPRASPAGAPAPPPPPHPPVSSLVTGDAALAYPMPLVPFLKVGPLRASMLERLEAAPSAPSGAAIMLAGTVFGVQAWVSPLHLWHLLSVELTVRRMVQRFRASSLLAEKRRAGHGAERGGGDGEGGGVASVPGPPAPGPPTKTFRKLVVMFGIGQTNVLWMIGTWTPKGLPGRAGAAPAFRRQWGITVRRGDPAFVWAQWLAPIYSIAIADARGVLRLEADGGTLAGATLDGVIVRDLQLPERAQHAYVLRPLPVRARRLSHWVASMRRRFLGIRRVSPARLRWVTAVQAVMLARRIRGTGDAGALLAVPPLHSVALGGLGGGATLGPQFRVQFRGYGGGALPSGCTRHPPEDEADLEVGQMLVYARVKQQASIAAAATQLAQIVAALTAPRKDVTAAGGGAGGADRGAAAASPVPATTAPDRHDTDRRGLRVKVLVVGIDLLFRVQSRDLMSVKLQSGTLVAERRRLGRGAMPRDVRLRITAAIQDVMVQDLRAGAEHCMVLVPNGGAEYCSFDAAFTSHVDGTVAAPSLVLELQNPRILLLFRFVADLLHAANIVESAAGSTAPPAAERAGEGAAAGAVEEPDMAGVAGPRAPQPPVPSAEAAAKARVLEGGAAAPLPEADDLLPDVDDPGECGVAGPGPCLPLQIVVQLSNVGIVLPTSATSRSVLGAHMEHVLLAIPGDALPASTLEDCNLPSLGVMVEESLLSNATYKYSAFHRAAEEGAGECSGAAGEAGNGRVPPAPHPPIPGTHAVPGTPPACGDAGPAGPSTAPPAPESGAGASPAPRADQDLTFRGRVLRAAEEEAVGSLTPVHGVQAPRRRLARPPGVLYLDEAELSGAQRELAGVLRIKPDLAARHLARAEDIRGADRAAAAAGGGGRRLSWRGAAARARTAAAAASSSSADPASPSSAEARQPRARLGGAPPPPPEPEDVPAEDSSRASDADAADGLEGNALLTPLDAKNRDEPAAKRRGPELPRPALALCVESFHVVRGTLIKVPNFNFQAADSSLTSKSKQGSFVPTSLVSFSWPTEVWDLVSGAPFLASCNVALTRFPRPDGVGQLHFSSTALAATFNAPNFCAIMDFVGGNLEDLLNPPHAPPAPLGPAPALRFNPAMKFGPRPGQRASTALTLAVPRLTLCLEAHPREWCAPAPGPRPVSALDAPELRPFLRLALSNLLLDFGSMCDGDKFLKVCATSLDAHDLRLAYRLEEVAALDPGGGGDTGSDAGAGSDGAGGHSDVASPGPSGRRSMDAALACTYPELPNPLGLAPRVGGPEVPGAAHRRRPLVGGDGGVRLTHRPEDGGAGDDGGDAGAARLGRRGDGGGGVRRGGDDALHPGTAGQHTVGPLRTTTGSGEFDVRPSPASSASAGSGVFSARGDPGPGRTASGRVSALGAGEDSLELQEDSFLDDGGLPAVPSGALSPQDSEWSVTPGPLTWTSEPTRSGGAGRDGRGGPGEAGPGPQLRPGVRPPSPGFGGFVLPSGPQARSGSPGGGPPQPPESVFGPRWAPRNSSGGEEATPAGQVHPALGGALRSGDGAGPPPTTGIRLSVARRLSEQADRRRSARASGTPAGLPTPLHTPATHFGERFCGGGGAPAPRDRTDPPVVDFVHVPELEARGLAADGAAVACLLSAPAPAAPETEGLLGPGEVPEGSNPRVKLEVSYALLADSTQAVEVALSNCLVSWPYFDDQSLVNTLTGLFGAPWAEGRGGEAAAARPAPASPSASTKPAAEPRPWTYFNAVLAEVEVFLPVYDVERAREMAAALWDAGEPTSRFHAVGDLALASVLLASLDEGAEAGALPLEARGVLLAAGAARLGHAAGGDGESCLRADLRDFSAHVRDPCARVHTVLLPFSGTATCDQVAPQVAEQEEVDRLHRAAATIQAHWLAHRARRRRDARLAGAFGSGTSSPAASLPTSFSMESEGEALGFPPPSPRSGAGAGNPDAVADSPDAAVTPWHVVDELILDVATPRTRALLQGYKRASAEHKEMVYLQRLRTTTLTAVSVEAGALTVRAAFSHIPFWRAAAAALRLVAGGAGAGPGSPGAPTSLDAAQASGAAPGAFVAPAPSAAAALGAPASPRRAAAPFRPYSLQISARAASLTAVLCNDKPETFGAPDVLLAGVSEVEAGYDTALVLPDRPPNKAGQLSLSSSAAFLNSSTSRWEAVYEPWPLRLEVVDVVSPLYLSDRRTNLWVTSDQHLDAAFNPASLMSFGDALAFYNTLLRPEPEPEDWESGSPAPMPAHPHHHKDVDPRQEARAVPPRPPPAAAAAAPARATPPAGSGPAAIMSLAPQKYLIQNQSGLRVYYWADGPRGGVRSPVFSLPNGGSENLRVLPAPKRLHFAHNVRGGGGAGSERVGATLHLHFEGNWMPLRDVAVNVVGKYRYRMASPADGTTVPVLVDIILVGRTKVITLHSSIWVENSIDRPLSLRLHTPTTPLVPPGAGARDAREARDAASADLAVGPLRPGAGCYLPLTSVLGGLLFLAPEGFCEAARDVVRLSADLGAVLAQQGYISCDPDPAGEEEFPLHVALQTTPARLVSEFQAFKHMECTAPGMIQRASSPLEITLCVKPPLLLRNALPYEMRVLLWQVNSQPGATSMGRGYASPRAAAGEGDGASGMPWSDVEGESGGTPHVEIPITREQEITVSHGKDAMGAASRSRRPRIESDTFTPRLGLSMAGGGSRGRYFCYAIPAGGSRGVYVDLRQTVLLHIAVEEIGMRSTKWALCSWAQRAVVGGRAGEPGEATMTQRLPRDIPLRMVSMEMPLPVLPEDNVGQYLVKLKEAALNLNVLHTRLARDARLALNRRDMERAVAHMRGMARRMRRSGASLVAKKASAASQRARRARLGRGSSAGRSGEEEDEQVAGGVDSTGPSFLWRESGVEVQAPARRAGRPAPGRPGDGGAGSEAQAPERGPDSRRPGGQTLPAISEGAETLSPHSPPPSLPASPFSQDAGGPATRWNQPAPTAAVVPPAGEPGAGASPPPLTRVSHPAPAATLPGVKARPLKRSTWRSLFRVGGKDALRAADSADGGATAAQPSPRPSDNTEVGTPREGPAGTPSKLPLLPRGARAGGSGAAAWRAGDEDVPLRERVARFDPGVQDAGDETGFQVVTRPAGTSGHGTHGTVSLQPLPASGGGEAEEGASAPGDSAPAAQQQLGPPPAVPWWRKLVVPRRQRAGRGRRDADDEEDDDGAEAGAEGRPAESSPRRSMLARAFAAWRERAADATVRRVTAGLGIRPRPPSVRTVERSAQSEADAAEAQMRAPALLLLGVHNSLVDAEAAGLPASGPCAMTLHVPYWLNNRTGVDLFTRDRASAPAQRWLLGAALPWDHGEVFSPGTSMTEGLDAAAAGEGLESGGWLGAGGSAGTHSNAGTTAPGSFLPSAVLEFKLVLMNRQESLRFGLAHVPRRRYSPSIPVKTVGNKGAVELRGPPSALRVGGAAAPPPRPGARAAGAAVVHGVAGAVTQGAAAPFHLAQRLLTPSPPSAPSTVEGAAARAAPGGDAAGPSASGSSSGVAARESSRADWGYETREILGEDPAGLSAALPSGLSATAAGASRHLRRSSMQGQLLDVTSTAPGTRLVRVVEPGRDGGGGGGATPRARPRHRRSWSSLSGGTAAGSDGAAAAAVERGNASSPRETTLADAAAGATAPVDLEGEAGPSGRGARVDATPENSGESDGEVPGHRPTFLLPSRASADVAEAGLVRGTVQHARARSASFVERGTSAAPGEAEPTPASPPPTAPAGRGALASPTSPASGDDGDHAAVLDAMRRVSLAPGRARRTASSISDAGPGDSAGGQGPPRSARGGAPRRSTAPAGSFAATSGPSFGAAARAAAAASAEVSPEEADHLAQLERDRAASLAVTSGQRLFEFAVDVAAGPPESIYRHTKLVTLKPKYIIENQTGLAMRVKQLGTRDPPVWSHGSRASGGFAHVLDPGQRSAVYWDDAEKPRELIVQPLAPGGGGEEWAWSGGFPIPETEWYFGLRIRHRRGGRRYLNIPANVTVGGSGCVQVTLKALGSVPPYRIENRCKDVDLVFIQLPLVFRPNSRHFMDRLSPGQVMAYAWDQPMLMNKLRVQARVVGRASESRTADYAPDQLGDAPVLMLPTHGGAAERASAEGRLSRTLSAEVPDVVKQKLVSLLAAEFSKKVYVSVYADGPTRVLRFSDEKNTSSLEQYHVILDLTARLKQVETQLREVSASFARLNGMAGAHALDLYGRTTADEGAAPARRTDLVRRASKRVPLSSVQQAAVRAAQSRSAAVSFSAGHRRSLEGLPDLPRQGSAGGDAGGAVAEEEPVLMEMRPRGLQGQGGGERGDAGVVHAPAAPAAAGARSVRFDVAPAPGDGSSPGADAASPVAGVLRLDPGVAGARDREERLRPYRQLVVRTASEPGGPAPAPRGLGGSTLRDPAAPPAAQRSAASELELVRRTSTVPPPLNRMSSSRDWGHITTGAAAAATPPTGHGRLRLPGAPVPPGDAKRAALARSPSGTGLTGLFGGGGGAAPAHGAARATPGAGAARGAASSARRQDLLRGLGGGDAKLLIGGDLTVTVVSADGLHGSPRSTHAFARVRVRQPLGHSPAGGGAPRGAGVRDDDEDEMSGQTNVVWQSTEPVWDEALLFRDVSAVAELEVELWDLGGSRNSAQLNKLAADPQEVIKSCRFLGCAEVALGDTLNAPSGVALWYPLMRRCAADTVSGELQLRFAWEVTARGLLTIKLGVLERVLRQRTEILCALRPVPAATAALWAVDVDGKEAAAAAAEGGGGGASAQASAEEGGPAPGAGAQASPRRGAPSSPRLGPAGTLLPGDFAAASLGGPSAAGDEWVVRPSSVTARVLAKHAHDVSRRTLTVAVIEARGLEPRRGVVMALAASELPNPGVELAVSSAAAGVEAGASTAAIGHSLTPRWEGERHAFPRLDPADTRLTVRLLDCHSGLRHNRALLGEVTVAAGNVKGEDPVYVWLPLTPAKSKGPPGMVGAGVPELQVCLRMQWQREVVRGKSVKVEVALAGAGLLVMGGLQDELFNVTLDDVRGVAVQSRRELEFRGSIRKAQLDNQILDAVQPVVLAPAAKYGAAGTEREGALVSLEFVRSFAGAGAEGLELVVDSPRSPVAADAAGLGPGTDAGVADASAAAAARAAAAAAGPSASFEPQAAESAAVEDRQSIKSFKRVRLSIGHLDLLTDEAFLEAIQSFFASIPTADVWQDQAWQEQQRRLLAAQFGPREVESLAVNAVVPALEEENGADAALDWVIAKETQDLAVLHGQSDLSSWYFVEHAEIGGVLINVTVSLTSRLLTGERALATRSVQSADAFHRSLSASGFQLVNVGNVPIGLGRWVVGSDPSLRGGRFSNGFLSQRALQSNLLRHYRREALKEAHKVLSGAGPAIASVPLTVIWASGSAFSLLRAISRGATGPGAAAQQFVYVPLMGISMIVSGFSRMLAAVLAALPPARADGDAATVQRIIQRPGSSLEALFRVGQELGLGVAAGLSGIILDPVAGWRAGGWAGLSLGLAKGLVLGLLGRPLVGVLEAGSQLSGAFARAALGREGILGKLQRRVRAPGAHGDDPGDSLDERVGGEARVALRALVDAWQRVLPQFFPVLARDRVLDVVNLRPSRVLLVTDRHLAYLRARHLRAHSVYRAKWLVPLSEVQNLTGSAESMKLALTHVHRYDLWLLGVWPVAARKKMRCGSRSVYEHTVAKLSRLLQAAKAGGGRLGWGDREDALRGGAAQLTILSAPYHPPEAGAVAAGAQRPAPPADAK